MKPIAFVAFCEDVLKVKLTNGQRVLALVAIDKVDPALLDDADRELAGKLGVDVLAPPSAQMVLAIVKGARIGGSYVFGALYSLWRALTADVSTLAPGEVAVALVVAPDLRLARQVLRYALGAAESVPAIAQLIESKTSDGFVLARHEGRNVSIECLPATRGGSAVRGRSLVSAVLSEAAFFRDDSAAVNDVDVFRAVAPRVLAGGLVILESTPWTESGLLHDLFQRNHHEPQDAIAALCPTLVMRDDERTRLIVHNEYLRDPENAEREFGAQFIFGGSGLFFGPELLRGAIVDEEPYRSKGSFESISIGADVGLVTDASAIVAVGTRGDTVTLCDFEERRPKKGSPLKLSSVVGSFCSFAERYDERVIVVDHHELEAGKEHLPAGFTLTPCAGGGDAKTARFLKVRDLLRQEQLRIPSRLSKITNQLSLIVSKPKPGGGTSIVLPRRAGTHLDVASAFILAVDSAVGGGFGARFVRAMNAMADREKQQPTGTTQNIWRDAMNNCFLSD